MIRRHAQEHPELYREASARWRKNNPEKLRDQRSALYYKDHEENLRKKRERDTARRECNSLMVLELDDGACGICGEDVDPLDFQVDHVIPRSKGGADHITNYQVAHPFCNMSKGNRLPWL